MFETIGFVFGVLLTIATGVLSMIVYDKLRQRVVFRRIRHAHDPALAQFFDVYDHVFEESERSSHDDFVRWLNERSQNIDNIQARCDTYIYIIMFGAKAIGVMYFDYYKQIDYIFMGFIGINKHEMQSIEGKHTFGTRYIVPHMRSIIDKKTPTCKGILFEIEHERYAQTHHERQKRRARKALYKNYARVAKSGIYELDCMYVHPRFTLEETDPLYEEQMRLILVTRVPLKNTLLSKAQALALIQAIYLSWYADSYISQPAASQQYCNYLQDLLVRYEQTLPDQVALLPI